MRLSTTVNLFIPPFETSKEACVAELERYKRLGFDYLDAIMCSAHAPASPLRRPDWRDWAAFIRAEADRLGITFVQAHVPFYNFCCPPAGLPGDIEEMVDRSIEAAAIFGAPYTVAHPATALGAGMVVKASKAANLDYFSRRLETAARCGIGIALENMADFDGGGRNRWYCAWVEELCDLIDTLDAGSGLVGACWDFGHANLVYPSQREALLCLGKRLKVTHTHDNCGTRDDHLSPFRGTVNWKEVMTTLADMGYERDLSFEVKRILNPDADPAIIDSLWRHLRLVGGCLIAMYDQARTGTAR